jgi:U3 small nucleolar RNA-associated protein 4
MQIHRCRFLPAQPSAINHLAATPANYPNPLVSVCRANGDLEIWSTSLQPLPLALDVNFSLPQDASVNWHCIHTIPGRENSTIEAVAFAVSCDTVDSDSDDDGAPRSYRQNATITPRLFSASLDGQLIEYDLQTMQSLVRSDAYGGGAIWCLAVSASQEYLAVGCEDGCIRMFDIRGPAGSLEFVRAFDKQKGRIVCLAWLDDADGKTLLSGSADGMIRKWDVTTGRALQRMSVGVTSTASSGDDVLVWSLLALRFVFLHF